MATMVPELPLATSSDAEGKLYEALHTLSDDYRIYHSLAYRLAREGPVREGEIDFLVIHPEKGLLAIEVKGGQISYEGRSYLWKSRSASGKANTIQDPFRQVQHQLKDLIREIERRKPWGDESVAFVHGHAVAFPDCEYCHERADRGSQRACHRRERPHATDREASRRDLLALAQAGM